MKDTSKRHTFWKRVALAIGVGFAGLWILTAVVVGIGIYKNLPYLGAFITNLTTTSSSSPVASPGALQEVTEEPITYTSFCTGKTGTTYASLLVTQKANDGKTYNMPQKDWDCYWQKEAEIKKANTSTTSNDLIDCPVTRTAFDSKMTTKSDCDARMNEYLALSREYTASLKGAIDAQQALWSAQDAYRLEQFKIQGEENLAAFQNTTNQGATEVQSYLDEMNNVSVPNLTITADPTCVPKPIIQGSTSGFSCL